MGPPLPHSTYPLIDLNGEIANLLHAPRQLAQLAVVAMEHQLEISQVRRQSIEPLDEPQLTPSPVAA